MPLQFERSPAKFIQAPKPVESRAGRAACEQRHGDPRNTCILDGGCTGESLKLTVVLPRFVQRPRESDQRASTKTRVRRASQVSVEPGGTGRIVLPVLLAFSRLETGRACLRHGRSHREIEKTFRRMDSESASRQL